jgi:5-methylcytosine-specific restriction endonuclease McrA
MKRSPIKRKAPMKRKASAKKPKLKNRSWYTKRLEAIAKSLCKERDGYICQHTGQKVSGSNAHASHIIPKSLGLRFLFDLDNLKTLCYHSHINWWHKNPVEAAEWLEKERPWLYRYTQEIRRQTLDIPTWALAAFYEDVKNVVKDWQYYRVMFVTMIGPYIKERE